jgi:hypothetical protein
MGRISFHQSLYSPEAVETAAQAYADYAEIALERSGDEVVAVISAVKAGDPETVEHSFCNLALQETIVRSHRTDPPAAEEE